MKKKVFVGFTGAMVFLLGWYLFLKPGDYLVSFTANTFPGAINQTIKVWGKQKFLGKVIDQKGLLDLHQQFKFGDSIVNYNWSIIPITDSTSKVQVRIKDTRHSLKNRLLIPFSKTIIEKRARRIVKDYSEYLNNHIKKFKVRVVGEDIVPTSFCAYLEITGIQADKAFGMMRDFPYLSGYVKDNNIEPDGIPFVEITKWNQDNDSISYNFCYPIKRPDSLPEHDEIKFKYIEQRKALKAIYNGNYITSDRAWYRLMDYAKKENIKIEGNPVEVFYDNPATNANELEWKAEIYMPIKDSNE